MKQKLESSSLRHMMRKRSSRRLERTALCLGSYSPYLHRPYLVDSDADYWWWNTCTHSKHQTKARRTSSCIFCKLAESRRIMQNLLEAFRILQKLVGACRISQNLAESRKNLAESPRISEKLAKAFRNILSGDEGLSACSTSSIFMMVPKKAGIHSLICPCSAQKVVPRPLP